MYEQLDWIRELSVETLEAIERLRSPGCEAWTEASELNGFAGCQEWPQAKKLLKQAQGVAKSEAKRLHALDKQNRQKILDKSSKAEQPPAAKQEKGGKHKEPKNTAKQKQKRRFAELFDQIEAEDYQYSPPQTSTTIPQN